MGEGIRRKGKNIIKEHKTILRSDSCVHHLNGDDDFMGVYVFYIYMYIYIVKVAQSCPTLCNPMDHTVHGILQARILEWVAFPSPGDLPNAGIEPRSPTMQADSIPAKPQVCVCVCVCVYTRVCVCQNASNCMV